MMEAESLIVTLAHEELVLALWLLRVRTLPSLPDPPLTGGPREDVARCLGIAERTLRARGLIRGEAEGPVVLADELASIVVSCARGRDVFVHAELGAAGLHVEYVYRANDLTVLHRSVLPGVHTFAARVAVTGLREFLEDSLGELSPAEVKRADLLLPASAWEELSRGLARGTADAELESRPFDARLGRVRRLSLLSHMTQGSEPQGGSKTKLVIDSSSGPWLVEPGVVTGGGEIEIRPTTRAELLAWWTSGMAGGVGG